ncbi:OsmC family protein [Patulibacter sp. SYSU D01012]|uniref:OsmC family protein n=1 Tax=Patulibacter sp. SYSU D01012 TaxID=2817381 RepID=UPI001B30F5C3|nr:OsmC family protein [Patulibacter sp. SYSU D01012]
MQVTARATREEHFRHSVSMRGHRITVDEPTEMGGDDAGPAPHDLLAASLASCTAITLQMYAERKGWDLGDLEVECHYKPAPERGCPTRFELVMRVDERIDDETVAKLRIIATKCPIHRVLDGDVMFEERVERVAHVA